MICVQNFCPDFVCINSESFLDGDAQASVDEVICQHLFREGHVRVAETLARVSHRRFIKQYSLCNFTLQISDSSVYNIVVFCSLI